MPTTKELRSTGNNKPGTAYFRDARNRNVLFQSDPSHHQRRKNSSNATASEAAAIQQSLSRTQQLLKYELDRVHKVSTAIESDGKMLQDTMHDHQTMNVSSAAKAFTALERAQQFEQRVLMLSIFFFWLCVFYVMWCRVLIRLPFVDIMLVDLPTYLLGKSRGLIWRYLT
jgi:hypothetical protein